jgi:hypothetical protein
MPSRIISLQDFFPEMAAAADVKVQEFRPASMLKVRAAVGKEVTCTPRASIV